MKNGKSFSDLLALAISTCGVGYLPIAPGTWGSLVGVGIYLAYAETLAKVKFVLLDFGWSHQQYTAFFFSIGVVLLILLSFTGFWAANRTEKLHDKKDSQKIVVDEVIGQLVVFSFLPLAIPLWLVLAGFLLFRIFDIWKPYPVKAVERLKDGIGVCADDIVAGIYGGVCLSIIYWISLSF